MKKQLYLVVTYSGRMGASPDYRILDAKELQTIRDYGAYMDVYKVDKLKKSERAELQIGKKWKPRKVWF